MLWRHDFTCSVLLARTSLSTVTPRGKISPSDQGFQVKRHVRFGIKFDISGIVNLSSLTAVLSHKRHGISNHRQLDCLFNCLFLLTWKKISNPALVSFYEGNPPVTNRFLSSRATNAGGVGMWLSEYITQCSYLSSYIEKNMRKI